jgi:hypothetical protein
MFIIRSMVARFSEPRDGQYAASGAGHGVYSPSNTHVTVCALQAIAPMQIHSKVYGDHGANKHTRGPDGKRDWTYSLFSCFDRCGLCT